MRDEFGVRAKKAGARVQAAGDPRVGGEALGVLAADTSPSVRRAVAARTDAPVQVMVSLAGDKDLRTRQAVVANPACPPEALALLVRDAHWSVRLDVPGHPNLDPATIDLVCATGDQDVRALLAQRDDLDAATARRLAGDPDRAVRAALARGTRDPETLAVLVADPEPGVRADTVHNPWLTGDQRRHLAAPGRGSWRSSEAHP